MSVRTFSHGLQNMYDSHTCVPEIYFPNLLLCESIPVTQFYESNATSAKVARNPVLHRVINNACWLLACLSLMK